MTIAFQAPRFDAQGKKTANAKLLKVVFNGQVIHENQELLTPTGDRWKNPGKWPRGRSWSRPITAPWRFAN